ncbi:MAG: glycosyltransferase [Oxalobacter sp.]|nr:MAG: glycosyltransferase [Oxalobacter sp.]
MNMDCIVIVFAKAPIAGFAKTRLAAAIGEDAAATLAARMIDETLRHAVAADVGSVILYCTPDVTHPVFVQAQATYSIPLAQQDEGDIGQRMYSAMTIALRDYPRAILIGTDIPALDAQAIRQAAQDLRQHPVVFIPAQDGGYVLTGLSRMIPEIFEGIDWSTSRVMEQTRNKLSQRGIRWIEYPPLRDIDAPEDLPFVPAEWLA